MYPIQKGDGQGEFELMGSLAGVLPSLSWGTHPGARIGWEEGRRKGRKGSPPRSLGSLRKKETRNLLNWIFWAGSFQTNPVPSL